MDAYPLKDYANPTDIYATAVTDYLFACSGLAMTRWASQYMPVYAYEFADGTAPSYIASTTFPLLSAHTFELSYLFPGFHGGDGTTVKLNSLQERLSSAMIAYWTKASGMAERGDEWPRYDPARDNVMELVQPAPKSRDQAFRIAHKCDFWDASGAY